MVLMSPPRSLAGEIRALAFAVRSDGPERTAGGPDDSGVALGEFFVADAPGIERSRLEVAEHDVRGFDQFAENSDAGRLVQVEGQTSLAAVAADKPGAARVFA